MEKYDDIVNFTNIDTKDFVGTWGEEETDIDPTWGNPRVIGRQLREYPCKAGETLRNLPRFKAQAFAEHLAERMLMEKGQDFGDTNPEKAKLIKQMVVEAPDTAKPVEIGRVEAEEEFADIAPSQPIKRKPGRPASVLKESLAGLKGTLPTEVLE